MLQGSDPDQVQPQHASKGLSAPSKMDYCATCACNRCLGQQASSELSVPAGLCLSARHAGGALPGLH